MCARVVGLGEGTATLAVGDLVTVEPHLYCGVCIHCQTGRVHMCPDRRAPGVHVDGGMAELLVVPEPIAYRLPADTPPSVGLAVSHISTKLAGDDLGRHTPIVQFICSRELNQPKYVSRTRRRRVYQQHQDATTSRAALDATIPLAIGLLHWQLDYPTT